MFTFKSLTAANNPKIIEASDHYEIKHNLDGIAVSLLTICE